MDEEDEDFRLIPGFAHAYMMNREGDVRNYRTGNMIKPGSTPGTWLVKLYAPDGTQKTRGVRGLLKRTFPQG